MELQDQIDELKIQLKQQQEENFLQIAQAGEKLDLADQTSKKVKKSLENERTEKQNLEEKIRELNSEMRAKERHYEEIEQSLEDKNTQIHALTREIQQIVSGQDAPQNLINPGNKHSVIQGNPEMWGTFRQKIKGDQIEAHTKANRPSEEYQNNNIFNFVDLNEPQKKDDLEAGREENFHKLHQGNLPNDSMPFYPVKDGSPATSVKGKRNSPSREKVAVSTIRYELEPAPHRMLDSDADIKLLSNPGRSSIDTGFGGLAPRIIITENNTAKNTIIPKHAQPQKEDQIQKMLKENEQLKKENEKLKSASHPKQGQQAHQNKIVSSPTIVMTPSLGRPTPSNANYPLPEPIHDSSKNIQDLRHPGMDSFCEEIEKEDGFDASFEPQNQRTKPKFDPSKASPSIPIINNYNEPNYNTHGELNSNARGDPVSHDYHELPPYVPLARSHDSKEASLVRLNQSEEYKVDQTLHNYFKNLDDYLRTGQHPDHVHNTPPNLDT